MYLYNYKRYIKCFHQRTRIFTSSYFFICTVQNIFKPRFTLRCGNEAMQVQLNLCGFMHICQSKSHPKIAKSSRETTLWNWCSTTNATSHWLRGSHCRRFDMHQCEPGLKYILDPDLFFYFFVQPPVRETPTRRITRSSSVQTQSYSSDSDPFNSSPGKNLKI